jgi:hypothetical protein
MKILAEIKHALQVQRFGHNPNFRDHRPHVAADVTCGV